MNIGIIGTGGREHALAYRLSLESHVKNILVIPGNDGMKKDSKVKIAPWDGSPQHAITLLKNMDFTIIGPEKHICDGLGDYLNKNNILCLAPSQFLSQLESSKFFAKKFMENNNIPTAKAHLASSLTEALSILKTWPHTHPPVVKVNGLAGGKGVVVPSTMEEAKQALYDFMENPNSAVKTQEILLEEHLEGEEISAFALFDVHNYIHLGCSRDYKRLQTGDRGPNTGGMGSFCTQEMNSPQNLNIINQTIFDKVHQGFKKNQQHYNGILFCGLMKNKDQYKVIEFNIRFGDPETQSLLIALEGNLSQALYDACDPKKSLKTKKEYSLVVNQASHHVVMASKGYPQLCQTKPSMLLKQKIILPKHNDVSKKQKIFFSGAEISKTGDMINTGGRVLGITTLDKELKSARKKTYELVKQIHFEGAQYRADIGNFVD